MECAVRYADDTLLTARGGTFEKAASLAISGTAEAVRRIEALGLRVALNKSEAYSSMGLNVIHPLAP
ncbi:unnamed protein product [Euphydryas editha]|uniref:Reverse transcriptase domain-containing protein n=1 Tax=Euphydryas editha TaxID=104508 RepID=A0AAU9V6C6_EUPED|nr:unnamed protein product [Euphydryas editha]